MKVMHIETGRHQYGGALQVCYLMEGLAQRGVENILVCTKGSRIAQEASGYATVIEIPMQGDMDFVFPFRLLSKLKEHKPDVINVHSRRGADLWSGFCARLANVPSVLIRRVDNREWPPFVKFKYGTYDQIVSISDGIKKVLLSEGLVSEQVLCIHDAVRSDDYRLPRDRRWFASEFGISETAPVLGVIAQLIPRKGHRYLLEIVPRLLEKFSGMRILFFGQGPMLEELKSDVAAKGLGEVVIFAGFRNDMPKILPSLDLVVHPALMEGLGVSLLQAAAAGVPIVGSRTGGIPEAVRDGINGRLVEPGDSGQLYGAICELFENPELLLRFGSAGRELIKQEFSVNIMVDRYEALYHKLVLAG